MDFRVFIGGVVLTVGTAAAFAWSRRRRGARAAERSAASPASDPALEETITLERLAVEVEEAGPTTASILDWLFRHSLGDQGAEDPAEPELHARIESATLAALESITSNHKHQPRRPLLLPQLLQAVNNDASSMREIAAIIGKDPALTGNLLRIANSPAYRVQREPIESIERAATVLGTLGIRSTITAALLQPVLSATGAFAKFPEIIWEHTVRAASAAEAHAALTVDDDPFVAQLVGLLHGLGAICVFRMARDEFAAHPQAKPSARLISRLVESQAGPTAARIAESWELSGRVVETLAAERDGSNGLDSGSLGRSLHFGRVTAALALLMEAGLMTPSEALGQVPGRQRMPAQIDRIWQRMTRASEESEERRRASGATTTLRRTAIRS
ncbi:HDOD domain-containing protein [bacterium]|nr:MAG: HDOD domain-containing protein [bacterium]